ncbi:MAG: hypothetical protein L6R35_007083, partial [Caloplaca aegaea]
TPVLLLYDEALQPRECAPGLSSEDKLQVEDVSVPEKCLGYLDGVAVDFEDRKDEGICDVALEEPGVFIVAAVVAMLVAEATIINAGQPDS